MASPSYSEIIKYSGEVSTLAKSAKEAMRRAIKGLHGHELVDAALGVVENYGMQAGELGAQWHDFCAAKAGVGANDAVLDPIDLRDYQFEFDDLVASFELDEIDEAELYRRMEEIAADMAASHSRDVIYENMVRNQFLDARIDPNDRRIRWARIPVGETCAWCISLASLGAWYLSEESAGGNGNDFHFKCDCAVVPYTSPDEIAGYASSLGRYRDWYATADKDARDGNISDELKTRIERAHERHDRLYAEGKVTRKWQQLNETLIVMRDYYGLD